MVSSHLPLVISLLLYQRLVLGLEEEHCNMNLQVTGNNKSYDITSAARVPATAAGRWAGRPAVVTVQLCSEGTCAAPAAACIGPADGSGPPLVANAGHITNTTALVVKDGSQLQLDLAPGQPCQSQGRNTTFNTTILFICESPVASGNDQGSEERQVAVMGDCSLLVIWYTAAACALPASEPAHCPLLSQWPRGSRPGLTGLVTARWRAEANGTAVSAQLCGGGGSADPDAPCGGAPICVTEPGAADSRPVPVGSRDQPALLTAANGSVTLTYGQQGKERAEVLLLCREEAGAGRLKLRRRQPQLLQLTLETAVTCPVRQVECRVTAENGSLRDLSQLSLRSGGWETTDHAAAQPVDHFYINLCRPLSHDRLPALCGGVAGTAVCMEPIGGGRPVSLGAVGGPPSLAPDGSIAILYTNGSQCGDDRFSSEVRLVCAADRRDQSLLLAGRDGCRYTFLWETSVACGQQESSGRQCAVSEPLYGHLLDVSSLRRTDADYALRQDDGRTLYLNLCGPLLRRCAGATDQGACLVDANGTETSYGGASSRLWHANGVLSLRLTGGAPCDPSANHSTRVVFTCDQAAPADVRPGLMPLGDCVSYVVVPTRQACPPRRAADCRTTDGRYDLGRLTALTGNHVYREPNATYVLNVCHSVNPEEEVNCPPGSASCLVRPAADGQLSYTSLGVVSGGPVLRDDHLVLRYTSGQPCNGSSAHPRRAATEITFSCDPSALGTQPRLVSGDDCLYRFAWTTANACPLPEARPTSDCTVQNPQTGHRFDLSPLARKEGYVASLAGSQYQLNVCSALQQQTGGCTADTGICKTDLSNGSMKLSVGTANDNLIFDDGVLLLNYSGGAPCAAGGRYHTIVRFFCGPEGGRPVPHVVEDRLCTVTVSWPTELACERRVECFVDTPDGLVDLSPLVRSHGTETASGPSESDSGGGGGGGQRFTVNVCRALAPADGMRCRPGSAACLSRGTEYQGLGHVVSPPRQQSDHVSVTYEHGSPCVGQPGRNLSSELQLFCDASRPDSESRPDRPLLADCRYTFRWRTAAACPLSPAAALARRRCRLRRPDSSVADLNMLTEGPGQQVDAPGGRTVLLRPCQADGQCGGAVCVGDVSYGDLASLAISQSDGGQTVTLQYTTEAACTETGGGRRTRAATLRLVCDPALGRGTPTVTQVTPCLVAAEWHSSVVCGTARADRPPSNSDPTVDHGTGHAVAWLLVVALAAALVAFLVCRSRWRGWPSACACCQLWGALRRQLLSPGTRATAHYRPVLTEDVDESESALLLEAPLEEQSSPLPTRRPPAGQRRPPSPTDMTDVCLDPSYDSDDELLIV